MQYTNIEFLTDELETLDPTQGYRSYLIRDKPDDNFPSEIKHESIVERFIDLDQSAKNALNNKEFDYIGLKSVLLYITSLNAQSIEVIDNYNSLFFEIHKLEATLHYEYFLEDMPNQPQIVYLIYRESECVAFGSGTLESTSQEILESLSKEHAVSH